MLENINKAKAIMSEHPEFEDMSIDFIQGFLCSRNIFIPESIIAKYTKKIYRLY